MSKIGQARPKCQLFFQGAAIAKFRLCTQQLKMVLRQKLGAEAHRLCILKSCIFSHYVILLLHNLLCHSPLSNRLGPFFFFFFCSCNLKYQCAAECVFNLQCCVFSQWCFSLSVLCGSSCLWPETAVECRFIISSHPFSSSLSLPSLLLVCPPSLVLKIDTPSISSTPALSLANCLDGVRTENRGRERED